MQSGTPEYSTLISAILNAAHWSVAHQNLAHWNQSHWMGHMETRRTTMWHVESGHIKWGIL